MKLNELGYPVVSEEIHSKIFGPEKPKAMTPRDQKRAESLLNRFGVSVPVDYPNNLYDGPLPLPDLKGHNLEEHFHSIANLQIGRYLELAEEFSTSKLPPVPQEKDIQFNPGWTRYFWNGEEFEVEQVDYPTEEVFTFDTETFVQGGAFPVIGTALSSKAAYIWLASELINPSLPEEEWDQFDLIPVGKDRFIVGHNVSYDRVRAQEGYNLNNTRPENFYFDTLSAHVGVSGLASGQRWLYVLAAKDPENLTEEEKRKLRYAPKWLEKGATNSLVQCYNFHVYEVKKFFGDSSAQPLGFEDKAVRDVFVRATHISQITSMLGKAVDYAVKDALYTAELFQALWPKYRDSTPSPVALCGHYYLNGSVVPLIDEWTDWIANTERVFQEHNEEMSRICKDLLYSCYEEWQELSTESERDEWVKKDPWFSQLDWTVASTKGKYANVPNWIRPFSKDPNTPIGVKSRIAHLLLKLKWEGQPLQFVEGSGWCYWNEEEGSISKVPHPKGTGENVGGLLTKDFIEDMNVGRLSSDLPEAKRALEISSATSYWTSVRSRVMDRIFLKSENPYGKDALVTLPEILCHGTVTRRTVEALMVTMCSTKPNRIGTELKSRITAPEGWKIVGADFDAQELNIAAIYSDKWEGGHIGCSPFGYNVLSGAKELGTDPHTALARAIMPELYQGIVWDSHKGVCELSEDKSTLTPISKERYKEIAKARDLAKIVGFTVLYGGGARAIQTYIRKIYPEKSPSQVKNFAFKALSSKKGQLQGGLYEGGTDSGCFNYMEEIAMRSKVPTLPCLGTKISTAMRPSAVGDDFKTGRVNWTIQSSGAEILSIMLTAVHWLSEEYKIPCRFIISIHDEVWFMTPEKYSQQFAVLFQIAHMYTWSLFHSRVGIPELPLSRSYFSSVAIDSKIRKSPRESTVSPSNPKGNEEPNGEEFSMMELSEIGAIDKLTTRYRAISQGLI